MKILLTADRPSGKLHLGHYVGSLQNRVELQDDYESYIMVADVQALTDNFENPELINKSVYEVAKDYFSVGIDPNKATVFIQSQIPEITELTMYYMNLVTLGRLERNPTVKTELAQKGMDDSIPVGFLCYPVNQAADITIFNAEIIPVGKDQLPMIEQSNEIVRKFNKLYNVDFLKESTALLSSTNSRLPGLDGKGKASKSLGNAILLSETDEVLKEKVNSMFTDPDHIKITDKGKVEGNIVFTYLDSFHKDKDELEDLKSHYSRGGLGDTKIKEILLEDLRSLLGPIKQRRAELKDSDIKEILFQGSQKARLKAKETIRKVRECIGINYFY